jgi:hypothetical protein
MTTPDALRSRLRDALDDRLGAVAATRGAQVKALELAPVARRQRTSVRPGGPATARLDDGRTLRLWAKVLNHPDPALIDLLDDLCARAHAAGRHDLVPRLWALDAETGTALFDRVDGEPMQPCVARALATRTADASYLADGAALTLARLHGLTVAPGPTLRQLAEPVRAALGASTAHAPHAAALTAHLDALPDTPTPRARLHNDYTLRNLLVAGRRVRAVDWDALVHPDFPPVADVWHDVAAFVVNLESLRRFAPVLSRRRIATASRAFLATYAAEAGVDPHCARAGVWLARLRLDLGLVERPLDGVYSGIGGGAFVTGHRAALARGFED